MKDNQEKRKERKHALFKWNTIEGICSAGKQKLKNNKRIKKTEQEKCGV